MDYQTFLKLKEIISKHETSDFHYGRPNGPVLPETILSCSIHYFAGVSVWDIMITHGISRTQLYKCVWIVVDLVNTQKQNPFLAESNENSVFLQQPWYQPYVDQVNKHPP